MRLILAMFPILMASVALAQQQPQMLPLTEWRAQIDFELARVAMSREAHGQIIAILQNAERQAQAEKMVRSREPPKEGQ